jgi:CSLREA domain-containing protein
VLPAGASALAIEVDTVEDLNEANCAESCSLRDAIEVANSTLEGPDKITFGAGAEGTIEPQTPLPELEGEVDLDATTAPGWEDEPVVALDGEKTVIEGGQTWGIQAAVNSKVRIEGLAIGGFYIGVWIGSEFGADLCGNRIGTNPAGTAANPNWIGVAITSYGRGVRVGRGCPEEFGGNLISGNSEWGVEVAGDEVGIDDNLVGTKAVGTAPLPNGTPPPQPFGGGIYVTSQADEVLVGGTDLAGLPHNVIAFNRGPGVLLGDDANFTTVRQNSIHSNTGLGIERESGTLFAEIASVAEIVNGTTTVTGTVHGVANTEYELEFFSSEACDPSGFGEGRYFVGSIGDEIETDGSGQGEFSATLLALVLPAAHFFTLTATDASKTMTSQFSNCVSAPQTPEEEQQPPPQPPPPPPLPPTPVNGRSVTVVPKSGRVLVKVPGSNKFVPLEDLESVPVGSIIDATNGRVTLTSVDANGVTQTADFYEGRFQILQKEGGALVTLRLRGGDFSSCPKAGSSARAAKRSGRKLWGSGAGRFRTQGNFGAASVRGTIWLTVDQCKGTFFKVRKGVVTVTDFVADKVLSLPAGKSYWAKKQQG